MPQQIGLKNERLNLRWCFENFPCVEEMLHWPTHRMAHESYLSSDTLDRKEPEKQEVVA